MIGALFSNDGQIGDDGKRAVLPEGLLRTLMADDAERRQRAAIATAKVLAESDEASRSKAVRLGAHLTKNRARDYLRWPWQMDSIWPDLSRRSPDDVLRIVEMEQERVDRFVGLGGAVKPINLRAAALVARYERRRERVAITAVAAE